MQIYQGVDIVEIRKFRGVFSGNNDLVLDIFTEKERQYCLSFSNPYVRFAGRFASKEACLKALGVGLYEPGNSHVFQEIEVVSSSSGKPALSMSGWIEKIRKKLRISQSTLSISHSSSLCIATVMMLGADERTYFGSIQV